VPDPDRYLGIDVHQPYIDMMRDPSHGPEWSYQCSPWDVALAGFDDHEFDLVCALDFIEHLERDDGLWFIEEAQRVGRVVAIFTPVGPFPQPYAHPDQWGMDGGVWQMHRSAWTPEDFPGWEVIVWKGFAVVDGHMNPLPEPHDAFWALKEA
jgi:hypothetical protein